MSKPSNPYLCGGPFTTTNGFPMEPSDHQAVRAAAILNVASMAMMDALVALGPRATKKAKRAVARRIEDSFPQIDADLRKVALDAGCAEADLGVVDARPAVPLPSKQDFIKAQVLAEAREEAVRRGMVLDEAALLKTLEEMS